MNPQKANPSALFATLSDVSYMTEPSAVWNLDKSLALANCFKKINAMLPPISVHAIKDGT